jgi:hypothetical protein
MKAVVADPVPVITEEEIEKILDDPDLDIKCTCPDGKCYTGQCCLQIPDQGCNPDPNAPGGGADCPPPGQ